MNFWPHYDSDELAGVQQVLASKRVNYWNGAEGRCFEREFTAAMGRP
ncbi:hypothetical protein [Nitrococcus mobilis]|uniref:Uncharacterized protein n=1 Tax=Nitrococcus mobilis Nb-231 TaxID=314278 RepID=A4BSS9_9GAMM|nr:hypothetical protein [Nitrococcus mobilis]EAR21173.1 hypothetical protein NB231_00590 [Nitrococcus mobilis Nb-231]